MINRALHADDAGIAFIDLQEGIVNVGTTTPAARLRAAVGGLAELAALYAMPVVTTAVPTTSGTVAPLLAELTARATAPLVRTTANAMHDAPFRAAVEAMGRGTVIVAGVVTEVAVALTAIEAQASGLHVVVAVDACSGIDARTESATFVRLSALGIVLSSVPAIAAELAGDFSTPAGRAAMGALQAMLATPEHRHGHEHEHEHGLSPTGD